MGTPQQEYTDLDGRAAIGTPLYHFVNDLCERATLPEKVAFSRAMWSFVTSQREDTHQPEFTPGWYANRAKMAGMSEHKIRALAVILLT